MSDGDNIKAVAGSEDRVIILKSDDSDRFLSVQSALLIKSAKYFESCLSFDSKVEELSFDSKIIPFTTLEMVVMYIEMTAVEPTPETLENLLRAADYLQMESLLKILYEYLVKLMNSWDVRQSMVKKSTLRMFLRIYDIINRYKIRNKVSVSIRCFKYNCNCRTDGSICNAHIPMELETFLAIHFEQINSEVEFLKLPVDTLRVILSSYWLYSTELEVLKTIKMWVRHDYTSRKIFFESLLECVRAPIEPVKVLNELYCSCTSQDSQCLHSNALCLALLAHKTIGKSIDLFINSTPRHHTRS